MTITYPSKTRKISVYIVKLARALVFISNQSETKFLPKKGMHYE